MVEDSFGKYVKKIGNKFYPIGRDVIHSDNLWQERAWSVRRDGERYLFEFLVAAQGRGTDTYEITKEEFESVKAGRLTFQDLIRLTDFSPTRKPIRQT